MNSQSKDVARRLLQAAMGIRVVAEESTAPEELPRPRPKATKQIPLNAESVRSEIRRLEQLRSQRDRYLENARVNQREAELAIEQDVAIQARLVDEVGDAAVIDVDGVLYEISAAGVRVSENQLLT